MEGREEKVPGGGEGGFIVWMEDMYFEFLYNKKQSNEKYNPLPPSQTKRKENNLPLVLTSGRSLRFLTSLDRYANVLTTSQQRASQVRIANRLVARYVNILLLFCSNEKPRRTRADLGRCAFAESLHPARLVNALERGIVVYAWFAAPLGLVRK